MLICLSSGNFLKLNCASDPIWTGTSLNLGRANTWSQLNPFSPGFDAGSCKTYPSIGARENDYLGHPFEATPVFPFHFYSHWWLFSFFHSSCYYYLISYFGFFEIAIIFWNPYLFFNFLLKFDLNSAFPHWFLQFQCFAAKLVVITK